MKEYFLWLAKLITVIVIFCFIVPILLISVFAGSAAIMEKGIEGGPSAKKSRVAVIELEGAIMESKTVLEDLKKEIEDPKIKAVVLRISSPGGAVGPSQDIYSAVSKWKERKPIVVSMGTVAASGGLYSALGASKVYAQPGTITGSIGVIMQLPNFKEIADKIGVSMVTIKSGALKDVGNSFRPMTEEEHAFLQGTISDAYGDFVQAVVDGRKLEKEKVLKFADGRILLGSKAKELGLVDELGDIYDAARGALELAGEKIPSREIPELYYPKDKFAQFRKLLDSHLLIRFFGQQSMQLMYMME